MNGWNSRTALRFLARIVAALLPVVVLPVVLNGAVSSANAEKKGSFVSQNYIDAQVDRAFYILNSVGDPASGITREQAVAAAKEISAKLRNIAETDANRKYILWKVGELDGQIYLEEQGLLLEKEQYRQKSVNDIIPRFNAVLGKSRPNFKELWIIHARMAALDANAAIDVENSIRKRAFVLAREVPFLLEAALEDGKIDDARKELVYCQVNQEYLGMSPTRYAALEAKVTAQSRAENEGAIVTKSLEDIRAALAKNDLAAANREGRFVKGKIATLRTSMVPYEWNRLNKEVELQVGKLERREIELVNRVLSTLREKGPTAAKAQLDTIKTLGVSHEKTGPLEHRILESVIAQKQKTEASVQVAAAEEDSAAGTMVLDEMLAAAKKKTAQKSDSMAAMSAERVRTTQTEEVRRDRLRVTYHLQKIRDEEKKTTDKQIALQELVSIYTSIELNRPKEAQQQFLKSRELLKKNLPAEDFNKVALLVEKDAKTASKK